MANKCATISLAVCLLLSLTAIEARYASFNINLAMTVSEDSHKLSEDMVLICTQQTDISMDELARFHQNDFRNSSQATQCFAHCMYEQLGLMHDGVFVERDFIRSVSGLTDPNMLLHKKCHELQAPNKCERALKIHQCLVAEGFNFADLAAKTSTPATTIAPAIA